MKQADSNLADCTLLNTNPNMIKKLTSFLDYGIFAEAALAIFALVFIAIVIRTLLMNSDLTNEQASIVLSDKNGERQ